MKGTICTIIVRRGVGLIKREDGSKIPYVLKDTSFKLGDVVEFEVESNYAVNLK